MNKDELSAIFDAQQRINKSLDERFEKDAELYIAPEQVEMLKNLIYLGNYSELVKKCSPTIKKFAPHVMANVLIKNAWLMRKSKYDILQPVFENCETRYLNAAMLEVFDNKIDMPADFRIWLIATYLKKLDAAACESILNQNLRFLYNPTLKAICVAQILKTLPLERRCKTFDDYARLSQNLLTQETVFIPLFKSEEFTDAVRNLIFDEHIAKDSVASRFWVDRLGAGDIPFILKKFKQYCKTHSSNLIYCNAVLSRFVSICRKDFPAFAKGHAEACACMDTDDFKRRLARALLNRSNDTEKEILKKELAKLKIKDVEESELATVDGIIERLNEDSLKPGVYNYLVLSFAKNGGWDIRAGLNKIDDAVDKKDNFKEFCFRLLERTDRTPTLNIKYLAYIIDNLIEPNADKNNPTVKKILKYIVDKDIFSSCKVFKEFQTVNDFVKEKDFGLWLKLKN